MGHPWIPPLTMRCLLLLPVLFAVATPAPGGPIWWNVEDMMWNAEDWAYDLSYNLTHMNAGGPFGFGVLGTTPPPQPGLLESLLGLVFPTTTTTTLQLRLQPQLDVGESLDWDWHVDVNFL